MMMEMDRKERLEKENMANASFGNSEISFR